MSATSPRHRPTFIPLLLLPYTEIRGNIIVEGIEDHYPQLSEPPSIIITLDALHL